MLEQVWTVQPQLPQVMFGSQIFDRGLNQLPRYQIQGASIAFPPKGRPVSARLVSELSGGANRRMLAIQLSFAQKNIESRSDDNQSSEEHSR